MTKVHDTQGPVCNALSVVVNVSAKSLRSLALVEGLAEAAVARHAFEPAVMLLAAASAWRAANDCPVSPYDRRDYNRVLGAARSGWKRAAFGEAWAAGAVMSLEQAIEHSPSSNPERTLRPTRTESGEVLALLTPREQDVARQVARGLTNRGIADELGIAPATAALHVEHIRGKLGFHSRAQIAAWIARV